MPIMLSFYEIFWVLRMIFKQLKPNPSSSIGLTAQEPSKFSYSTFLKIKMVGRRAAYANAGFSSLTFKDVIKVLCE